MYPERILKALQRAQAYIHAGHPAGALEDLEKVVAKVPKGFEGWLALGQAKGMLNDHAGAEPCFRKAAVIQPKNPDGWYNLGLSLSSQGKLEQACAAFEKAASVSPATHPALVYNLASCQLQLDHFDEAIRLFESLLATKDDGEVWTLLGMSYQGAGQPRNALDAYRHALERGSGGYTLNLNLGTCHYALNDYGNAAKYAQLAVDAKPGDDAALYNLGVAQFSAGHLQPALDAFSRSNLPAARESRLLCLNYVTPLDPHALKAEHEAFARRCFGSGPTSAPTASRAEGAPLHVGFLSGDFREHPVAYFIEGMLRQMDRSRYRIYLYSTARNGDVVTERFRALADGWHDVQGCDNSALAAKVAADGVHVMIDLAGYTDGGRMAAFARRLAPVQAAYLGYCTTTGVQAMDYLLTDDVLDPPGLTESHYTERVLRLGPVFATYTPPPLDVKIGPLPMLQNGYPTFASFAQLRKISPDTLDMWCAALRAVPSAKMKIMCKGLDAPDTAAELLERFAQNGIDQSRLQLRGAGSMTEFLEAHNAIDLILDSVPWNGHTTTLHGLWMGVPTVSVRGQHHAGRFGEMVLNAVGLNDWVVDSAARFHSRVAQLAGDSARLAALRERGRDTLLQSPLCDHAGLAHRFEAACELMWSNHSSPHAPL